jgi:hypothetical protein
MSDDPMSDDPMSDDAMNDDTVTITNEFTSVRVRKVFTRNGERLEVHSAKLGFTVQLDPLELESLTWQTPDVFSGFLQDPYGPEDVTGARPLSDLMAPDAGGGTSGDAATSGHDGQAPPPPQP